MRILLITGEDECAKCREAKEIILRLTQRFPDLEYRQLLADDPEAVPYGIVMSPTVVVDDTIISSGRAPNERKLTAFVEEVMGRG